MHGHFCLTVILIHLKNIIMRIFFFWFTRMSGICLILFQVYHYLFDNGFQWDHLKGQSLIYDLSYLIGFNLFLLAGFFLILISIIIRKKNYSTEGRQR